MPSDERDERKTLRQLREERGLSREQLAADLHISFGTLVNLEMGRNMPRVRLAEQLYRYFDVPLGMIDWETPVADYRARMAQPKAAKPGKTAPVAA